MDLSQLQAATPTGAMTGEMALGDLAALRKALEAGYGTDVATLTGGGALRIQSLDTTMQATLADNKHFALFNALSKTDATYSILYITVDGSPYFKGKAIAIILGYTDTENILPSLTTKLPHFQSL
jgi:hypothetical protein